MNILHIGDVVGTSGRKVLKTMLPLIIEEEGIDFTVVNVENAAGGFGLTEKIGKSILTSGADVLTSGNHIFDKDGIASYLDGEARLLRPLNYPPGTAGRGVGSYVTEAGVVITVINASGRTFMEPLDCPFQRIDALLSEIKTKIVILDFHGEATSEKLAMANHLDGRVSAVLGTHTHVQTADEQIFPGGTAYITDVGMTGSFNSIIGMEKKGSMTRIINHLPVKLIPAKGDEKICGVVLVVNDKTGRAQSIRRVSKNMNGR